MVYSLFNADSTAAALYIMNIITVKDITMKTNQKTVLPEKLTVAKLHIQFPVFYTTRTFIPIFTTA
jgi:hypothetical protein